MPRNTRTARRATCPVASGKFYAPVAGVYKPRPVAGGYKGEPVPHPVAGGRQLVPASRRNTTAGGSHA